ncbi:MAG: hypothetical protein J7501_10365 [Bdellovibrio sp.]|nr:hypothetical protein [Bdellovibrio sp.]
MLKFASKMAVVAGVLATVGLTGCASWGPKEEPRQPSSYVEETPNRPSPWHYPFMKVTNRSEFY